jgi:hypothetical protein
MHVRLVHERARGFAPRRRVHVLLVAATLAVAGAAFAGAAGVGPLARLRPAWVGETRGVPPAKAAVSSAEPRRAEPGARSEPPPAEPEVAPAAANPPAAEPLPPTPRASTGTNGAPAASQHETESQLEFVNRTFADAKRAKREGRDAEALALFEQLLGRYPRSVLAQEASVERMRTLVRLGRKADAQRAAQKYLARYPSGFAREEAERLAPERTLP